MDNLCLHGSSKFTLTSDPSPVLEHKSIKGATDYSATLTGIRTFRSPVFSLLGAKVPSGNLRSQEQKFPGTFAPGNECFRELSFLVYSVRFLTMVRMLALQ